MTKYKVLDLFCGAGGLSLGFKLAGFQIVGGIDFQQDAIYTHEKNFKNSISICGDIKEITDNKLKMIQEINCFSNSLDLSEFYNQRQL